MSIEPRNSPDRIVTHQDNVIKIRLLSVVKTSKLGEDIQQYCTLSGTPDINSVIGVRTPQWFS